MPEDRRPFSQSAYEKALDELYEVIDNRPRMLYGITQISARQVLADNAAYMAALDQIFSRPSNKDVSADDSNHDAP